MSQYGTSGYSVYGTWVELPREYTLSTCGEGPGVCSGHTNYPENCTRTHRRLLNKLTISTTNTAGVITTCPIS